MADDVQRDDDQQDEQSYEKPEVEDLESDGPSATAAGITITNGSNGSSTG